jgi:hypothetical protein
MRAFGLTSHCVVCAAGNVPLTSAGISAAAIVRSYTTITGNTTILNMGESGNEWAFGWHSTSKWRFYNGSGVGIGTTSITANTFYLAGFSKAAGTTLPRFHWLDMTTNTWTHENATGGIADSTTPVTPVTYIGRHRNVDSTFNGAINLVAVWNRVLTDAEFEALSYGLLPWYASAPAAGWLLDQSATTQNVLDWTGGGANQTSLTGTGIDVNSVPSFSYGMPPLYLERQPAAAGGGGTNSPRDLLLLGAG